MNTEQVQIVTEDGWHLAASWYRAQEPAFGLTVVLCAEFGHNREDYAAYALYLKQHGMDVLCFDYRGGGESAAPLNGGVAHLLDWGRQDLAAGLTWAAQKRPDNRMVLVAHGLGGLLPGLAPLPASLCGMLCVAPANGFFAGLTFLQRRWLGFKSRFLWPLLRMFGGKIRLPQGIGSGLPDSLIREWTQWCFHPQPPVDAYGVSFQQGFLAWHKPIRCYSFVTDPDEPTRSIHEIAARFPRAPVELVRGASAELPPGLTGYACFFKHEMQHRYWDETVQWMQRVGPAPVGEKLIEV